MASGGDVSVQQAARRLASARDVTLLAHLRPDADALGSALALGAVLRKAGATVRVSFSEPDDVPESLRDLVGSGSTAGLVVPPGEVPDRPPMLVAVDMGSVDRLGSLAGRVAATIDAGGDVLVVDHHVGNTRFGTLHLVDEQAEATVVLALALLDELGADLDEDIARCLYAGLVTDTRSFRRATPETHRVAARLLAVGVDPDATARKLLDDHPFAWLAMLSTVVGRARLEPASAQGWGLVHAGVRMADSAGVRGEEIDTVIDILRTTSEAEVAAVLKETGARRWTVSLRSDGRLDVGSAALACGGGGHRFAAGFTMEGSSEQVLDKLRSALASAPQLR